MRVRLTVLSIALALAGCGSMSLEEKRVDYKANAVKASSLEVPPDLTVPSAENHYTVPDGGGSVASYSDFATDSATAQSRASAVLPESRTVRMERDGERRWLVVEDKAENIWPVIRAFWQENGFALKVEDPRAGVMETDWAENRAKIPKAGLRSLLGKVVDGLYDSGEKDMYRVRLERVGEGRTEVYLTQYGIEEVLSTDKSLSKWQQRPNDPDLEATMLQMLMAKLGGAEAEAQARAQSESATKRSPVPQLQTLADGNKVILLSEPFDRSWRKVGLALEHEGFVIEDRDRSNGVYFLRTEEEAKEKGLLDKMAFWRKEEGAKAAHYRVTVREVKAGSEVAAREEGGGGDANTRRIIDSLYQALR